MHTINTLTAVDSRPVAMSIGNFDGLHLGHRAMLDTLIETAGECVPSVMTFDPHPKCVFQPCQDFLLTDTSQRIKLIAETSVERCWLMPFDDAFRTLTPEEFIDKLLAMNVQKLVVGEDFRFGHQGKGNVTRLAQDFSVIEIATQFDENGHRISSSLIRDAIRAGDFARASKMLGRDFSYTGRVEHGQKLGRTLGFPTANIAIDDTRLMPAGVFSVDIILNNESYQGIANCGRRPTIGDNVNRLLEVFFFDFEDDLYEKNLTVFPKTKIRDEQKFRDIDALMAQIHHDIGVAKALR